MKTTLLTLKNITATLSASLLACVLVTTTAYAAPFNLSPGSAVNLNTYEDYEVTETDPDWSGLVLGSGRAEVQVQRDGVGPFPPYDVIQNLYDVTAIMDTQVVRSSTGQLVLSYNFSGLDNSGGGVNGITGFSLSGFAGFDLDYAWRASGPNVAPYVPQISRSADGDIVTFEFLDPRDGVLGGFETFLLAMDAPGFASTGSASAAVVIDTFGTLNEGVTGFVPVPVAAVPLPASGLALGLGLGLCALAVRRRKIV